LNHIKNLGSQSLVYGLSSIVPRFLNYLLTPLFNYNFPVFEIGQVTLLYTYVVFLNIILTYGMETGFFYFSKKESNNSVVFGTSFLSLVFSTLLFLIVSFIFIKQVAVVIDFKENLRYIVWFLLIVSLDTFSAIPFARLRFLNKALKFASIKIIGVLVSVIFNLIFIWVIPKFFLSSDGTFFGFHYKLDIELIFIANFISSAVVLVLLAPIIFTSKYSFDKHLLKKMFIYSLPLMVAGLAGTINDLSDRLLLQYFLPKHVNAIREIGIYGSSAKLAVLMTLFIQMFRFAAEPFFFNQKKGTDQNFILADVSKYFIYYGLIIFLGVLAFMDLLKYYVGPSAYWPGLRIIPAYMFSKLCVGIYFNLSFWYKLSGRTYYGIVITGIGTLLSIILNIIFIPHFSYIGCAYVNLITYLTMIIISFYLGKKYVDIKYDLKNIFKFTGIGVIIAIVMFYMPLHHISLNIFKNLLLLGVFVLYLEKSEKIFSLFIKK
jgi:O-antigen/teichoic acid export membrane protein